MADKKKYADLSEAVAALPVGAESEISESTRDSALALLDDYEACGVEPPKFFTHGDAIAFTWGDIRILRSSTICENEVFLREYTE